MVMKRRENKTLVRSKWKWWSRKRAFYTISMMVVGLAAYLLIIFPKSETIKENRISDVSFVVHMLAYLVFLIAANIFFFAGLLIDHLFNKKRTEKFQLITFYAIMLVSLPLPFLIPKYFPGLMELIFNLLFGTLLQLS